MAADAKTQWLRLAAAGRRKFNFGWWLQMWLPWVVWSGAVAAAVVLVLRALDFSSAVGITIFPVGLAVGALIAWFAAKPHFLSQAAALARLDEDLVLHNRLTSANEGVGDWPGFRPGSQMKLHWDARVFSWQAPAALAALLLAAILPLPMLTPGADAAVAEPAAWAAVDQQLESLREEELTQPEALDQFEEALDALRQQPRDSWFAHESLEASDHLLGSVTSGVQDLQAGLEAALGALEASRQLADSQFATLSPALENALQAALEQLAGGTLPLDSKFLSDLQNLDLSNVRQLTPEQWKEIQDRLSKGISTCSSGFCSGEGAGSELLALIMGQGNGGIGRGPGDAPLTLSDKGTDLGTTDIESLSNEDLSRAAMGDLLGLGVGEHDIDTSAGLHPEAGGAINASPGGGSAIDQSATPAEQQALRLFFR